MTHGGMRRWNVFRTMLFVGLKTSAELYVCSGALAMICRKLRVNRLASLIKRQSWEVDPGPVSVADTLARVWRVLRIRIESDIMPVKLRVSSQKRNLVERNAWTRLLSASPASLCWASSSSARCLTQCRHEYRSCGETPFIVSGEMLAARLPGRRRLHMS